MELFKRYQTAFVADYQNYENYGAHDWDGQGACPQYWKPKGGEERVLCTVPACDTHVVDMCALGIKAEELADKGDYYRQTVIGIRQAKLNPSTIRRVRQHLHGHRHDCDLGYARYVYGFDYEFDWAVAELQRRGEIEVGGPKYMETFQFAGGPF